MNRVILTAAIALLLSFPLAAQELIIVDARVPQSEMLTGNRTADVVQLTESDELDASLASLRGQYETVHLVGHGSPGHVQLGSTDLTAGNAHLLALLRPCLAIESDVLVYGCHSGAGKDGRALVDAIALATGADVAASDDFTGLGGDWELEVVHGIVKARPLSAREWQHHLQIVYQVAPGGVVDINPISSILPAGTTRMDIQLTTVPGTVHGSLFRFANFTYEPWGQGHPNPFTVFGSLGTFNENRIFSGNGLHYQASATATIGSVESIPVTYTDGFSTTSSTIQIQIANVYYPVITQQPIQNPQTNPGMTATLQVAASIPTPPTTGTLTYQWYSGIAPNASNPVSGATSPTFTWNVPGGQAVGQYLYWCRVTLVGQGFTASHTGTITVTNQTASVATMNAQGSNPTNGTSVTYTLEFAVTGPAVGGLSASNFSVTRTGTLASATVTNVVSGLGGQSVYPTWFITVGVGTGDGTVRLELVNATGATIGISGLPFNGQVVTFDRTRPTVSSITRQSANPTGAGSVDYLVTFSETVNGVANSNFSITQSGVTGATVGTPSSSSGTSMTVPVNTGSGSGTLRLNLNQSLSGISDPAGNQLNVAFNSGEVYDIDKTLPFVSSMVRVNTNPTNAASVQFTVTFNESVTGVAVGNFTIAANGVTGASVTSVTGSGSTRTVTISTGTGDGTLRLDLSSATPAIQDVALNSLSATFNTGESYNFDNVQPGVVSITRTGTSPTNSQTLGFLVTFNESVTGVGAGNFGLATTGAVSGATVTGVTGSGSTRTVTVDRGTGEGTIELEQSSTTPAVTDALGNTMGSTYTSGENYSIDLTPPGVSIGAPSVSSTTSGPVDFVITYTDAASVSLAVGDVSLNTTGDATGSISVSGSGTTTRTVTVSGITGNGTIGLSIASGTALDAVGNAALAAGPSATFSVTNVPGVSIGAPSTTLAAGGPVGFVITYTGATAITLAAGDVTLNSTGGVTGNISITGSGTSTRTVTVDGLTGDGSFTITLAAGTSTNPGGGDAGAGPSASVDVDNTLPALAVGGTLLLSQGTTQTGVAIGTVSDNYTAAGALNIAATGVPTGLVVTNIANTAGAVTADIESLPTSGTGVQQIEFTVTDQAGNSDSVNFTVDVLGNQAPTVSVIADQSIPMNTSTGTLAFTVDDFEDGPSALAIAVTVDNQILADPLTDFLLGGAGMNRTLAVTPQTNNVGVATVSVTVTDSAAVSTTVSFVLTVTDSTDAPAIAPISNILIYRDQTSAVFNFTATDPQGDGTLGAPAGDSLNTTLIQGTDFTFGGTAPNLSFQITPQAGQVGTAVVIIYISDGTYTASRAFTVVVQDPPSSSGGDDDDDEGCTTGTSGSMWLMLLVMIAVLGVALRVRRAV